MSRINLQEERLDGVLLKREKPMASWLLRIVFSGNRMADLGSAYLLEIRCKSGWWAWCRHICNKFGLKELVNLICLGDLCQCKWSG